MKKNQTIAIKDFKNNNKYFELIEAKLFGDLWQMIYKPMFKLLNIKAENDSNVILESLKAGDIFYNGQGFQAVKKFSNKVSTELIKLGAKYDKYSKTYVISLDKLPETISSRIIRSLENAQTSLEQINQFLDYLDLNIDNIVETMIFNDQVKTILDDAGNQVSENIKGLNIIEPELSEEQLNEIAESYTNNMQYYVKNWAEKRIPLMREEVKKAILSGFREDEVQKMLMKEYNIGKNKAKFLAHNETSIMLAEYKKVTYKEMGFNEFIWQTIRDGRERPLHYALNATIWEFDNPPVIDERTGQKGLPGETYNCRCNLVPIRRDELFFGKEYEQSEKNKIRYRQYLNV